MDAAIDERNRRAMGDTESEMESQMRKAAKRLHPVEHQGSYTNHSKAFKAAEKSPTEPIPSHSRFQDNIMLEDLFPNPPTAIYEAITSSTSVVEPSEVTYMLVSEGSKSLEHEEILKIKREFREFAAWSKANTGKFFQIH